MKADIYGPSHWVYFQFTSRQMRFFKIKLFKDNSFGEANKTWSPKYCPQSTSECGLQKVRQIFDMFESYKKKSDSGWHIFQ